MQVKLLVEIVKEIAGEPSGAVVELLLGKRDVNEFLIAKKMNLTINQVRNIFYKLGNFGLVSFTRKKDKRKGWYTYFWTLETYRAMELLDKRLEKDINELKNQLNNRQTKRFFTCKTCTTEVGEEAALLHNFLCQECGEVYELSESEKYIELLKNKIEKLEKQRVEVQVELGSLTEEKAKKNKKDENRAKKKKDKEKEKLKLLRKKAKKK